MEYTLHIYVYSHLLTCRAWDISCPPHWGTPGTCTLFVYDQFINFLSLQHYVALFLSCRVHTMPQGLVIRNLDVISCCFPNGLSHFLVNSDLNIPASALHLGRNHALLKIWLGNQPIAWVKE